MVEGKDRHRKRAASVVGFFQARPVALICGLLLLAGLGLAGDYGMSTDESAHITYARTTIKAYLGQGSEPIGPLDLPYYGPVFSAVAELGAGALSRIVPGWGQAVARHYVYFVSFVLAVAALITICKRFVSRRAALITGLLFATQPLLWGHAFINPKDTPFMAFFTASIALGLWSAHDWRSSRIHLSADNDEGSSGDATRRRAHFLAKGSQSVTWPRAGFEISRRRIHLGRWWMVVAAGMALGLTTSIRIAGPLAGALVSLVYLRHGRKAFLPLVFYWSVAAVITYATWPALWGSPIEHFLASIEKMSDFAHGSLELYRGYLIPADGLPWHFMPWLMTIQFTEPLLAAAITGGVVALSRMIKGHIDRLGLVLIVLWFGLPVGAQVLLGSTIYSNFRQYLFAVPPLFVVAALGLDWIDSKIKGWMVKLALMGLLLLPGLVGILRLHPYEYIYYNFVAGGVKGASAMYETDYWCTSYREAIEIVNEFAEEGASVGVHRLSGLAREYARQDLKVYAVFDEDQIQENPPQYLLVCSRSNFDETFMSDYEIVAEIRQAGARLAVVRRP